MLINDYPLYYEFCCLIVYHFSVSLTFPVMYIIIIIVCNVYHPQHCMTVISCDLLFVIIIIIESFPVSLIEFRPIITSLMHINFSCKA